MNLEPTFNLSWGNGKPIKGATYRPDINALNSRWERERHQQSGHQSLFHSSGSSVETAPPPEERPEMLEYFSTLDNGDFRRFLTPPTTPKFSSRPSTSHHIAKSRPDLLPSKSSYPDEILYSLAFYDETLSPNRQSEEYLHPLEKAFICSNLARTSAEITAAFNYEFPLSPWPTAYLRDRIDQARWHAKVYIWTAEELEILRAAALRGENEEDAWFSLRAEWLYYPKDRRAIGRKYMKIQQEVAQSVAWERSLLNLAQFSDLEE